MHSYRSAHCSSQGEVADLSLPRYGTVSGLGFATGKAGSPMHLAVSSSTLFCLWTGLSLPVALHPASRRRSYLQLRTGQCSRPERTFTLLLVRTLRRTFPGTSCRATIALSLRDKSHSPIEGLRIKLALMRVKTPG